MATTAIERIGEALKARQFKQREQAFIASLKQTVKTDALGSPSESRNPALISQVRQARNLLVDGVQR